MDEQPRLKGLRVPTAAVPGLILLGLSNGDVVCNKEAIRILTFPSTTVNMRRFSALIASKFPTLFRDIEASGADSHKVIELISGKRRYICSRWLLDLQGQQTQPVAILLERQASPDLIMHELCMQLQLTPRERQAVAYLVRGLTSKEIAKEMGISPNTVKTFLRLVMTKAGVSTRTGLLGRVAGITARSTMPNATESSEDGVRGRPALAVSNGRR